MEREKIKLALKCCAENDEKICKKCPYYKGDYCLCWDEEMCKDALGLITEQEKEIEQHKNNYDKAFERLKAQQREIDKLKADNQILTEALSYMAGLNGFRLSRTKLDDEIQYSYNGYLIDKETWLTLKKAEVIIAFWE